MTTRGSKLSITTALLMISLSLALPAAFADKPSVDDLAWMTGAWAGPAGPGITLEENWIMPTGGSIASLVRMTGNGETSMVELIVIEEENDSLVLRIKQWNSGFTPRTAAPQTMALEKIGPNNVHFIAAGEGRMKSLSYTKTAQDTFTVDVETIEGEKFHIELKAR
jgi:hypothetical protein